VAEDKDDGTPNGLRIARLTALLHEFELHLREHQLELARGCLAAITTTLALALTDAQKSAGKSR
jgi:hypothetical protein